MNVNQEPISPQATAEETLITEVDAASFDDRVIKQSYTRPVLADFWAPWCGPCRALAPTLQKIVEDAAGGVALAKINTDDNRELAAAHNIRSLPTVMLFKDGAPVDQFMGVRTESAIREMLDRHVMRESDIRLGQACEVYDSGDPDAAFALILDVIRRDPDNDRAKLKAMEWFVHHERYAEAEDVAKSIASSKRGDSGYRSNAALIQLARQRNAENTMQELAQRVAANPNDLEARQQLGIHLGLAGRCQEALDQFLEILEQDRKFRDQEPRRNILLIFDVLGAKGDIVNRYRARLARTLN